MPLPMNPLRQSGPAPASAGAMQPPPVADPIAAVKAAVKLLAQAVASGQTQGVDQQIAQLLGESDPMQGAPPPPMGGLGMG
jgi:hypothetical protein